MADGQPQAGDLGEAAGPPGRPTRAGAAGTARPGPARAPAATARLALAVVLLAVVLAGARAAIPAARWDDGPWHSGGIPLGICLEAVFVALLIAVELRRRRHPAAGQPAAGLRALLRVVLLIGAIAIPVLILINSAGKIRPSRQHPVTPPRQPLLRSERPHALTAHGAGSAGPLVLYILLVLALLAALVVCVILVRRRARASAWADVGEAIDDEPEEQLRRAVQSGQAALRQTDDARLAIIACYAAMEASLARAGAVRADAETPDELLGRAAAAGLVHGGEAARLTTLFYEARFSTHPLPSASLREARRALKALAGSLREKAAVPAEASP